MPANPLLSPTGPLRHSGTEIALGCLNCIHLEECGGTFASVFNCFDLCCDNPSDCKVLCPRADDFVSKYRDCGGITAGGAWKLCQNPPDILPRYVPMVQHWYRRRNPLNVPFVGIPMFSLVRNRDTYGPIAHSASSLKKQFKVVPESRVLLISIGADRRLEQYWKLRRSRSTPERLSELQVDFVVAPNYSMFLDVPRTDNLANRRRSLLCAEELSSVGCSVVPYVSAVTPHDWNFWKAFLREHSHISIVAKEFQTGPSNASIGRWHLENLLRIEDAIGRGLHVIAVGGRRQLPTLVRLSGFTLVDSVPFMKTVFRRELVRDRDRCRYVLRRTSRRETLDDLLARNINCYRQYVELRAQMLTARIQVRPLMTRASASRGITISLDALASCGLGKRWGHRSSECRSGFA